MPITARSSAGHVDASTCSDQEWEQVYRVRPRPDICCRDCGRPMHAKVSSTGLRFFAHDRRSPNCIHNGETHAHRMLKHCLADLIRSMGWTAIIEAYPSATDKGGWRADVLAISPESSRRIAFEAQMSSMSVADGQARTERYAADGIESIWITTKHARWLWTIPGVRIANLDETAVVEPHQLMVDRGLAKWDKRWAPQSDVPLATVVRGILEGTVVALRNEHWLYETVPYGQRTRELCHQSATALTTRKSSVSYASYLDDVRQKARLSEASRQRWQRNVEALVQRQRKLVGPAVRDVLAMSANAHVWVGAPPTAVSTPEEACALEELRGARATAGGVPIGIGPTSSELTLKALLAPVAGRITAEMAGRWKGLGVRVYVASPREADRVAVALGWPASDLVLVTDRAVARMSATK